MKTLLSFWTFLILFNSCSEVQDSTNDVIEENNTEAELIFLDEHNTESYLLIGTPTYDSIIANAHILEFNVVNKYQAMKENSIKDESFDTVAFRQNEKGIEIVKSVYTRGSCLDFLPYCNKKNDTLIVKMPDSMLGGLYIENGDTIVTFTSCTLEAFSDIVIKIDSSQYSEFKVIMFEEYYYSIVE